MTVQAASQVGGRPPAHGRGGDAMKGPAAGPKVAFLMTGAGPAGSSVDHLLVELRTALGPDK